MPDPVVEEYRRVAEEYDRRWAFYVQASVRETLARMSLSPGERVLEVGCGTGALLAPMRERWPEARLAGIDPVPEMLAVARRRLPPEVESREGWAEKIPHDDASFDLVVSCNMFHYVRRPREALAEMRRVLRPGGRLVVSDWCDDYLACRVCDWYLRLTSASHFKMYGWREMREMIEAGGFERVAVERYKISWLWGLMTATAAKGA